MPPAIARLVYLVSMLSLACGGATAVDDAGATPDAAPDVVDELVVVQGDGGASDAKDASAQKTVDAAASVACTWTGPTCSDPGVGCCFGSAFYECDPSDGGWTWQPLDAGGWPCP